MDFNIYYVVLILAAALITMIGIFIKHKIMTSKNVTIQKIEAAFGSRDLYLRLIQFEMQKTFGEQKGKELYSLICLTALDYKDYSINFIVDKIYRLLPEDNKVNKINIKLIVEGVLYVMADYQLKPNFDTSNSIDIKPDKPDKPDPQK